MFRILLLSDLHGRIPKVSFLKREDYTAVVLAGDITHGTLVSSRIDTFFQKLDFLGQFYFILGNSDDPSIMTIQLSNTNAVCLDQRVQLCENYEFLGINGATYGLFNQFALSEKEYEANLRSACALGRCDRAHQILVTHDPPRDTCLDINFHGNHVGSIATRRVVEDIQPLLVLSGHIHESRGVEIIGETTCVNGGAAKNGSGADIIVDQGQVSVKFIDF